jgi:23S rRNA (guanosine2251-2'-O)-methyltransferase
LSKKKPPERSRLVIYGVHPVLETLRAGKRHIEKVYVLTGSSVEREIGTRLEGLSLPLLRISGNEIASLAGSPHHQGIAARVGPFPYVELDHLMSESIHQSGPVLLLDGIQDPANLGSILRSAECLGATGIVLTTDRSASITPAAEKASAGASAHISVARVVNLVRALGELKAAGFWIHAADSRGSDSIYSVDFRGKIAFVVGSEGKGIRRLVRDTSDFVISIPMTGKIESLNVAQTAAILLAEALRQRSATHE